MSNRRRSIRKKFILFVVFGGFLIFSLLFNKGELTVAQDEDVVLANIGDRYVVVNWTVPASSIYDGFRIDYFDLNLNKNFTWSIILLNESEESTYEYFSQVNYSISEDLYLSQKLHTNNFTVYLVDISSETIQVKITGFQPVQTYSIAIYLVNTSLILDEGEYTIYATSEEFFWESEQIETLQGFEDQLEYSKLATSLSILVIAILFIALFIYFAKKDVPFNKIAYIFIFPALLALVLLEVYPILYGIFLSFTSYNLQRGENPIFNGIKNYAHITENPQLPIAFTTTLVWSTLIIIAKIVIGFILAYIIQFKVKRKKLWYLVLYIPWAIPSYIKILSWRTFVHGTGGASFFNLLFGTNVNMLTQPYVTLIIACFVEVWDSIPLITTLFLGGLSTIPNELNDIADIDQIREGTRIRRVIIPLIKPIILPAIILEIIKTFGSFNVAFLLTKGYPLLSYGTSEVGVIGATDLFSTFTFYMFYQKRDIGIAAAYSTIMSILTLFFVLIWMKMSRGTQSSFRPEQKKRLPKNHITLILLFILQAIGYLVAGITHFRYFGIHWNPYLSFIFSAAYFLIAVLCWRYPNNLLKVIKFSILLDLILSLVQFFFYQMWYAFNWNVFIIVAELYILSNIQKSDIPVIKQSVLQEIKDTYTKFYTKVKEITFRIDKNIIQLTPLHGILLIQTFVIFLSAFTIQVNIWLPWVVFSIFVCILTGNLFSKPLLKVSIVLQPLLWVTLIFSKYPSGWIFILGFISLLYILGSIELYSNEKSFKSPKIQKIIDKISVPRNNSAFLLSILLVALIPLWNIFWIAFSKGDSTVPTSFFPVNPTIENFTLLFTQEQIHFNFLNSLLISLGSAAICVLLTTLAAYAFSRYYFTGKKEVMVGVFTLKMFTGILTLIPFYLIMYNFGLIDSYFGVILAYSTHTIPLALWLIKGYMDSIPKELDESASLMGNSKLRVLRKIILPLAGPAIAITFLLNFLRSWNGFLLAFVLLQTPSKYTLPIKLYTFIGSIESSAPQWGLFAAASIIVIIPLLIVFVFLRNYILSGFDSSTSFREI
ncbi:MAG: ABC transporter permease subunit [Candidatus Thorarchaeota archaeon]